MRRYTSWEAPYPKNTLDDVHLLKMPKVSVIITTYNRAHLLSRAIESVLRQTFQDFEIIVVDDASSDNTREVINKYCDERIFYLYHEKNRGVSAARNTGLMHAAGQFVSFLDSDDEWLQEKLMKQVNALNYSSDRVGLVYSGYRRGNGDKLSTMPKAHGDLSRVIFTGDCIDGTPLIRKVCFLRVGFYDEEMTSGQDWDMWIRLSQQYHFNAVPEVLVLYYPQKDSITKNRMAKLKGYERLSMKYKSIISSLPRQIRAEHYLYVGKNLWWLRDIKGATRCIIKAIIANPLFVINIIDYFIIKKTIKYFRKIKYTFLAHL